MGIHSMRMTLTLERMEQDIVVFVPENDTIRIRTGHDRPYHTAMRGFNQRQAAMDAGQVPLFEVDTEAELQAIRDLLKHEGVNQ